MLSDVFLKSVHNSGHLLPVRAQFVKSKLPNAVDNGRYLSSHCTDCGHRGFDYRLAFYLRRNMSRVSQITGVVVAQHVLQIQQKYGMTEHIPLQVGFEFRIFQFQTSCHLKARELTLPCYLTHSCRVNECIPFSMEFVRKEQTRLEFEPGSSISSAHPYYIQTSLNFVQCRLLIVCELNLRRQVIYFLSHRELN